MPLAHQKGKIIKGYPTIPESSRELTGQGMDKDQPERDVLKDLKQLI
jgi:hypothetical protein